MGIVTAIICRPFLALIQLQVSLWLRIIKAAPDLHIADFLSVSKSTLKTHIYKSQNETVYGDLTLFLNGF